MIKHTTLTAILCLLGIVGAPHHADAAPIVLNLDCVINFNPCQPSAIYGTITLNQVGSGVSITVDLAGSGQKFRDLMLSYSGLATRIIDDDPLNSVFLSPNGFRIHPYDGLFDVGGSGGKGWSGNNSYSTLLTGDIPLLLTDFLAQDSSGVYAVIHIQGAGSRIEGYCEAGSGPGCALGLLDNGPKIGASTQQLQLTAVPEPASLVLMGTGLLGAVAARRRRKTAARPS